MNRRGFLQGLLATVALTTGLARARLDLRDGPGFEHEEDLIALLERKIRAAEADMVRQLTECIYSVST